MPESETRTTETSKSEGRLKVDAGCRHGRKKCLKCAIGKVKDGKGGGGLSIPSVKGGYGKPPRVSLNSPVMPSVLKKKKGKSVRIKKTKIKLKTTARKSLLRSLLRKVKK